MYQFLVFNCLFLFSFACTSSSLDADKKSSEQMLEMVVGTYTKKEGHVDGQAEGIYRYSVTKHGHLTNRQLIAEDIINPSYITLSPDGHFLFAVSEIGPDVDSIGYLHLYEWQQDKGWTFVNKQPSFAFAPCYVAVHPSGKLVALANYLGGTIALYPINRNKGLGEATSVLKLSGGSNHPRQDSSHPHATVFSPDGQYLFVPDLGSNKVWSFAVDTTNQKLRPTVQQAIELPPGAGPRHLAFHPNGRFAYLANELDNTVTAIQVNSNAELEILKHYKTLPENAKEKSYVADIHLTSDGKHLYVSNRGHNSLAHFVVNGNDGSLSAKGYYFVKGDFPRNFSIHPSDRWLYVANQNTNNIVALEIGLDGALTFHSEVNNPTPVCLQFRSVQ